MKKLYNEYFFIEKNGKVKEKVMIARITVAITLIVACLVAMTVSAYAFFTSNVTSVNNIIKSANFESDIKITYQNSEGNLVFVNTSEGENSSRNASLNAGVDYTVTISINEEAMAKTGFCVVSVKGNGNVYHTQQLGEDGDTVIEKIVFTLCVSEASVVNFYSHWGTSSCYDAYKNNIEDEELYIVDGDTVLIEAEASGSNVNTEDHTADTTGPVDNNVSAPETTPPADTAKPEDTTKPAETTKAPEVTTAPEPEVVEPEETTAVIEEETTVPPEETTAPVEETTAIPE